MANDAQADTGGPASARRSLHLMHSGVGFRCTLWVLCCWLVSGCGQPPIPVARESPRYEFEVGRVNYKAGRHLDAQAALKRFLDLNPGHALADSAQLLLGLSIYETESFAEAAIEFAILIREFPRSDLRDDASFYECSCFAGQMRPAELDPTFALRARTCFNEFLLRYPDSELRDRARKKLLEITDRLAEKEIRLGRLFVEMKRCRAGVVYLREVLQKYPSSHWVPEALFWLGRAYACMEDDAQARQYWEKLIESFPEHDRTEEAKARWNESPSMADSLADPQPHQSQ